MQYASVVADRAGIDALAAVDDEGGEMTDQQQLNGCFGSSMLGGWSARVIASDDSKNDPRYPLNRS
jgi:hypothetical protein